MVESTKNNSSSSQNALTDPITSFELMNLKPELYKGINGIAL